jgi:hypothetical protein
MTVQAIPWESGCEVLVVGNFACGGYAHYAYRAMGGGWMVLCRDHGEPHAHYAVTRDGHIGIYVGADGLPRSRRRKNVQSGHYNRTSYNRVAACLPCTSEEAQRRTGLPLDACRQHLSKAVARGRAISVVIDPKLGTKRYLPNTEARERLEDEG